MPQSILDEDKAVDPYNAADAVERRRLAKATGGISDAENKKFDDQTSPENYEKEGKSGDLGGGLYTGSGASEQQSSSSKSKGFLGGIGGKLKGMTTRRKIALSAATIGAIAGMGAGLFGILGFLNIFSLDHFMSNVESKSFVRYQVDMDNRSTKWINAYLEIRLSEVEDGSRAPADRDIVFRAQRVDNNKPFTDWYRTMRASSFEKDLLEKQGIKFVSVAYVENGVTKFRPAIVRVNGQDMSVDLREALNKGDFAAFDGKLSNFADIERLDGDRAARKAIKRAVNENTHWYQVMKSLYLRRSIQNMTGVRNWRFFEKTREKSSESVKSVRNKIVKTALPESTKSGKLVQCLLGMVNCSGSTDPNNPESRATSATSGDLGEEGEEGAAGADGEGEGEADRAISKLGVSQLTATFIKELVGKVNIATSILSVMQTISNVNSNMRDESLSKLVYMEKSAQAIGMYSTFGIARDQIRSGEVTTTEVSSFMSTVNGAGTSEGWNTVIDDSKNSSTVSAASFSTAKSEKEYCSSEHQADMLRPENKKAAESEYHYACDSEKIGGKNRAEKIENAWNSSAGPVLTPILKPYDETVGRAADKAEDILNALLEPAMSAALKAAGLDDNAKSVATWFIGKLVTVLGGGPSVDANAPSGVYANHVLMGASAASENATRFVGGAATTDTARVDAEQRIAAYNSEQSQSESLATRYFSLANPKSLFSTTLFSLTTSSTKMTFASAISSIQSLPTNLLFGARAHAAVKTGYEAADFAGVETYDIPKVCIDNDPRTITPELSTNADDLGLIAAGDLTWELMEDSDAFYAKIYADHPGTDEATIKQVYDCAPFDSVLRGATGAMYGVDPGPNSIKPGVKAGEDGTGGVDLTVASYNILHSENHTKNSMSVGGCNRNPVAGDPHCAKTRSDRQIQIITGNNVSNPAFDIVGTQETSPEQYDYLKKNLSGYDAIPEDTSRLNNAEDGGVAVWWNTSKLTKVTSGKAAGLSNTSKSITNPWVGLETVNGRKVYVMSIHYAVSGLGGSDASIRESSRLTMEWVKSVSGDNATVIVVGDFNDNLNQDLSYCVYTQGGLLQNTMDMENGEDPKQACPTNRNNGIDQVYATPTDALASGWTHTPESGIYKTASDHRPVYVKLKLGGSMENSGKGSNFKLGTYNISVKTPDSWDKVVENIKKKKIDIVGTQELERVANYRYIQSQMKAAGYGIYPDKSAGQDIVRSGSNARAILYNKAQFQLVKSELVPYPRYTGDPSGKIGGEEIPKNKANMPIIWLKDKKTGQLLIVMNTYNAADVNNQKNAEIRYQSAQVYIETIERLRQDYQGVPIFFTGDFNEGMSVRTSGNLTYQDNYQNLFYCMVSSNNLMMSAEAASDGKKTFCPNNSIGGFDYIYATPEVIVSNYTTIPKGDSGSGRPAGFVTVKVPKSSTGSATGGDSSGDTVSAKGWVWPVEEDDYPGTLSQCLEKPGHTGIDISVPTNTPVYAAKAGKVVGLSKVDNNDGGLYVILQHGANEFSNYQHNSAILVNIGDRVSAGDRIASSGHSGYVTSSTGGDGSHVHFSITTRNGLDSRSSVAYSVNPLSYLPDDRGTGSCK